MLIVLLFFPFFSFLISCFFSSYLGRTGVLLYSIFNISLVNVISFFLLVLFFLNNYNICLNLNYWMYFVQFNTSWLFNIDLLSMSMAYVVTLISLFVHIYSIDYMYSDHNRSLFLGYLSLFTFFMLLLVCSGNLFIFFLSWEGVGICSYLLINFWNSRVSATQSAIKALIVNRVSDLFLFVGLLQLVLLNNSSELSLLELCVYISNNEYVSGYNIDLQLLSCMFLFIGVVGKSAQLFLHTWLPDAMEGPTPVSALLHAATMVTAGIFLVLRFSFIFDNNVIILQYAGVLGAFTIIVSGTIGLFQFDIKKVIAYSTCSQLGYMLVACSASVYYISLYHFTIHAFFKALLFLLSGCLIHACMNEQDMRKYGGFLSVFPLSCILFVIGNSALVAEPFLSGFYSKELIIFSLNDVYISTYNFVYWISLYGALLTVLYSFRSLWLVFFTKLRGSISLVYGFNEISYIIMYPLVSLGLLSIFSGYILSSVYKDGSIFDVFTQNYNNSLFNHYIYDFLMYEHNFIILYCNYMIALLFILYVYLHIFISSRKSSVVIHLFNNKWFFDFIYNRVMVMPVLWSSEVYFNRFLDKGYIELFGPMGLYILLVTYYFKLTSLKAYTLYIDILYVFINLVIILLVLSCSYYVIYCIC